MRIKRTRRVARKPLAIDDLDINIALPMQSTEDIREMLREATVRRDEWLAYFESGKLSRKENAEALRNFTALRGVIKTLKWVLKSPEVAHPLD